MFRRFALCAVLISLSAGVLAAIPKPGRSPVPMAVGNRWEYSVSQIGVMSISDGEHSKSAPTKSTGTSVEEIIGIKEKRPNGDTVYEERLVTTTRKGVNSDASESVTDSIVLNSRDGTYVLASKSSGMGGLMSGEWVNYSPPLVLYGSELSLGSKWKVGTARDGKLIMPLHAQVAGTETVTVPAGTFENCTKVHITCTKVTGTMGEGEDRAEVTGGKSITTIWIAPGVGVVKEDSILQAKMEFPPDADGRVFTMTGTQRKIKELQPGYRAASE